MWEEGGHGAATSNSPPKIVFGWNPVFGLWIEMGATMQAYYNNYECVLKFRDVIN